jgi:hypothetical protein
MTIKKISEETFRTLITLMCYYLYGIQKVCRLNAIDDVLNLLQIPFLILRVHSCGSQRLLTLLLQKVANVTTPTLTRRLYQIMAIHSIVQVVVSSFRFRPNARTRGISINLSGNCIHLVPLSHV